MTDPLAALLHQMQKDGTWDSSGAFTLDLARAAARLGKDFAAAYPGHFLLRLVQAGVGFEASEIRFKPSRGRLQILYLEPRLPKLSEYFEFALHRTNNLPQSTPFFPLFQGMWAALSEGAQEVEIQVKDAIGLSDYSCKAEQVERRSERSLQSKAERFLAIQIWAKQLDTKAANKVLKARCSFSPVPIYWNNRKLPQGQAWAKLRTSEHQEWYRPWAPEGFRLGESYIGNPSGTIKKGVALPKVSQRKARAYGRGFEQKISKRWRPKANNVLFHRGVGEGVLCGAVAQTLDNQISTPIRLVYLGVEIDAPEGSLANAPDGGLAVLECSSCDIKTDIFGLRAVRGEGIKSAKKLVARQLQTIRRDVRTHLYEIKPTTNLADAQMIIGAAAVVSTPFLPGAMFLQALVLGSAQVGFGWVQKSMSNKASFLTFLGQHFPDLRGTQLATQRRSARYEL